METPQLTIVDALAQTSFLIQGRIEALAADHGLSLIQTRLLGILRDREPTINELADLLGLDKSSVSGLVIRAEKRELVARTRSQSDGRSVRVTLTGSGRALVDRVAAQFADEVSQLLAALAPGQRSQLSLLLSRVLVADARARGLGGLIAGG